MRDVRGKLTVIFFTPARKQSFCNLLECASEHLYLDSFNVKVLFCFLDISAFPTISSNHSDFIFCTLQLVEVLSFETLLWGLYLSYSLCEINVHFIPGLYSGTDLVYSRVKPRSPAPLLLYGRSSSE